MRHSGIRLRRSDGGSKHTKNARHGSSTYRGSTGCGICTVSRNLIRWSPGYGETFADRRTLKRSQVFHDLRPHATKATLTTAQRPPMYQVRFFERDHMKSVLTNSDAH